MPSSVYVDDATEAIHTMNVFLPNRICRFFPLWFDLDRNALWLAFPLDQFVVGKFAYECTFITAQLYVLFWA